MAMEQRIVFGIAFALGRRNLCGDQKMNMRSQSAFLSKTNLLRWVINLLLLPPAIASATAYAQDAWQIDPNDSIATFSSGAGAETLQVGVARVNGEFVFDSADPSDPTVRFSVNSNESTATYASMSFSSRHCARTADGKLRVTGELSVTRAERSMTIDANEAYAGPRNFGSPVCQRFAPLKSANFESRRLKCPAL